MLIWNPEWEEPVEQETAREDDQLARTRTSRKRWKQEETPAPKRQKLSKSDIRYFVNQPLVQQDTEDDWSDLVGRAEHPKCQAELKNQEGVRDCQADKQEAEEDNWSGSVGQAEHLSGPEAEDQAGQQRHLRLEEN